MMSLENEISYSRQVYNVDNCERITYKLISA